MWRSVPISRSEGGRATWYQATCRRASGVGHGRVMKGCSRGRTWRNPLFSVNYFCRLASTIFAGSGRRESRSTTMTPVGRVGVACDVQSGVENALPRRCTVAPCSRAFSMPLARSIGCSASGPSRRSGGRPSAGAGQQRTRSTSPGSRCRGGFPAGPVRVVARDVELKHVRRELLFRWTLIVLAGSARRGSRINNRDRERSRRNGGTTSAESRVGHAATCSVAGRVRPAVHPGPEHAAARGVLRARRSASLLVCLEQHGRPPPLAGRQRLHQVPAHA